MEFKLNILNLKCGGCANTITKRLSAIEGVSDINVDEESSIVKGTVIDEAYVAEVVKKLSNLGYPVSEEDNNAFKVANSYLSCIIGRVS